MILGIDPGSVESGYALIDHTYRVLEADKIPNKTLVKLIPEWMPAAVAIESIQSYGMAVGASVFETCMMIGRIQQKCDDILVEPFLYPRPEYAKAICGTSKISDSILRRALLLRFGGDRKGEHCFLLKGASDKRSAFAVAAHHLDRQNLYHFAPGAFR